MCKTVIQSCAIFRPGGPVVIIWWCTNNDCSVSLDIRLFACILLRTCLIMWFDDIHTLIMDCNWDHYAHFVIARLERGKQASKFMRNVTNKTTCSKIELFQIELFQKLSYCDVRSSYPKTWLKTFGVLIGWQEEY